MRLILACLLFALALPASAEIYKYTDANGNTVFTNQPPQGTNAQEVNLPPVNTLQAPTSQTQPGNGGQGAGGANEQVYRVLEIANLPSEEALRANNGDFTVMANLEPPLRIGDSLQLLVDGAPYGSLVSNPEFPVSNLDRGDHSLAVQAFSGDRRIQQSPTVTVTVQRTSVNNPTRVTPPKPTPKPAN